MNLTHGVTHWDPENCFGCRVKTVGFSPSCFFTTPGGSKAAAQKKAERGLTQDLDAFKRMRLQGLQPPRTRGAAKIESECESAYEVKTAQPAHKMAKGSDAGKSITRRGAEWRRRANEADRAVQRGEAIST